MSKNEEYLSEKEKYIIRANDKIKELEDRCKRYEGYLNSYYGKRIEMKKEIDRQQSIITDLTELVDKYEKELSKYQALVKSICEGNDESYE